MKLYGLTGGIGMGKSVSGNLLHQRGVCVADTDLIARELVEPGRPALAEIQECFGADITGADGRLRRDELGRRVFADADVRKRLEDILHPLIRAVWREQVERWRVEGRTQAVVIIPLLYETNAAEYFDAVVCVACSAASQRQRLLTRGLDLDQIEKRINAQWPVEKKMELADHVVWTEAGLDVHSEQIDRILR